jgi:delta14-sterol reductase
VSVEGVLLGLLIYGSFIALLFTLTKLLPAKKVLGQPLPGSGERLTYRINGMALFVAVHMLVFAGAWFLDLSLTPLLEHFWSLLVAANLITIAWLVAMNWLTRV